MADVRRLRQPKTGQGFTATLEHRGITPRSALAVALSEAIGRLRSAPQLPLDDDLPIDFWGNERWWAHRFTSSLWLYYRTDKSGADEFIELMAVHDYIHEM